MSASAMNAASSARSSACGREDVAPGFDRRPLEAPGIGRRLQQLLHRPDEERAPSSRDRAAAALLDADRRARHGVDVAADAERIANALALELLRELRRLDREVAVRLGVVVDDHAGEHAGHVHADQDVNRPVIAVLLRHEIGRPECQADRRRGRVGLRIDGVGREMERCAVERRERGGRGKQRLEMCVGLRDW